MRVRAIFKCSFCRGSFFALANGLWIKKVSKWTVLVQLKELLSFSFFSLLRLLLRRDYLFLYSKSSCSRHDEKILTETLQHPRTLSIP